MKIAIVPEGPLAFDGNNYFYTEGEAQYFQNISKYFENVVICSYAFHKDHSYFPAIAQEEISEPNITVNEFPLFKGKTAKIFQMVLVFYKLLKWSADWDVCYIFYPGYPGLFTSLVCRLRGVPYFCYLASDWPEESEILNPWAGSIFGKIIQPIFDLFVNWAQDSAVENSRFALTAGGFLKQKYENTKTPVFETIPRLNWRDLSLSPPKVLKIKKVFNILFVGYLIDRKGAHYLIDAMSILEKKLGQEFRLTIVGDGEQKDFLLDLAIRNKVSNKIFFKGHLNKSTGLFDEFRNADVFVVPSYGGEGFPRVIYEAMTFSLPIIATDICGIPYKLKKDKDALLIPPRSSEALADSIFEISTNQEMRERMSLNSYVFAKKLLENSDGGKQVHDLFVEYVESYR